MKRLLLFALIIALPAQAGKVADLRARAAQTASNLAFLNCIPDTVGNIICPDDLDHTYAYNGSSQLTSDTATDGTNTWVKTFTYSGSTVVTESGWLPQQ